MIGRERQQLRVLELSDKEEAAAFAGKLFRRWGAEVIKLETPNRPPPARAADIYLNGGKRRVRLDIREPAGRAAVDRLADGADVLLTDYSVRDIEGLDVLSLGGPEGPAARVTITPFGLSGPYAHYEATASTLLALGGYTWLMGDPGRAPLTMPGNYPFYQAGNYAYIAALASLLGGGKQPVEIEVAILECLASLHQFTDTMWLFGEQVRSRHGNRWENLCPTTLLPCADGWYGLNILQNFWFPFAHMVGRPDIAGEGPLSTNMGRMEKQDEVETIITRALWDVPKRQIFKDGQEAWRVPIGYAASLQDVLEDPHLAARSFWREVRVADKSLRSPGSPFSFVGEERPAEPAPLGPESGTPSWVSPAYARAETGRPAAHPLEGVRILDLTRIWSGPLATRILGDLGAEVIKIEARDSRGPAFGPATVERPWNRQGLFNKLSRNKKSISIDLKSEAGRKVFLDLVAISDVVIENFSARAMPGLGLAYDDLRAANDRIIYLTMPAFGMNGPYRDYVGLGPSIEPVTGLTAIMGYSDSEPRVTSKALTDATAGTTAASAVITALLKRSETGRGALIDLSQHEAGVAFLGEAFVESQLAGQEPGRIGNRHREFAPYGVYRCAGVDEWLALAARGQAEWAALCGVLGQPALATDSRFASPEARLANIVELDQTIEDVTKERTKRELEAALQAAAVPAGAVLSPPEYLSDAHLRSRGYFVELEHREAGITAWDGSPLRFDGQRGYEAWVAAPCLGQDNRGLLRSLLGFSEAAIDHLYEDRVLAESP